MSELNQAGLVIRSLGEADCVVWDEFVKESPDATFFHLSGWRTVVSRIFKHRTYYVYAQREEKVVAVLPLVEIRSFLFGHSLISSPFAVYGGVAGADAEARLALEGYAEGLARELGVDLLEYRNLQMQHEGWPRQDLYVTFRKAIEVDDEANMLAIPRKQRAMVRKGMKAGLSLTLDDDVDDFFAVYADNVRRHGTPALPYDWFSALRDVFGKDCEVLTVRDARGFPVSSVMSFYFRDEVLPYYAGDMPIARDLAANDFKYWELMRRAVARGCRTFDYGRSKVGTGPYNFKKNWGFEPIALSYEYVLIKRDSIPQNNPMNPRFRAAISLWRRLPLAVTNSIGPLIVRYLG